jgi:hypothetical protein
MVPGSPQSPGAWMVAWHQEAPRAWWGRRRVCVAQARIQAPDRQAALAQAVPLLNGGRFLFAVSHAQVKQGLSALVPQKTRSESHLQGAMLSWLPMVAPEFVVFSSLGGDTHAHPVRAACCHTALSTWSQAYHRHRAIACASRQEWLKVGQWLEGALLDIELFNAWSADTHSLAI